MKFQSMPRFLAVIAILACALPALAQTQGFSINGQVVNTYGVPVPFAPITVCPSTSTGIPCTPTANIFSDPGLSHALPNPTAADQYGNYSVFVASGPGYIVQVQADATVVYSYLWAASTIYSTQLLDSANLARLNTANTFTGNLTAPTFIGAFTGTLTGNVIGNTTTATALAAVPTSCTLPQVSLGVAANGNAICANPTTITGNAPTATAAASAPTQCASGLYSTGVNSMWTANCAQVQASQVASMPTYYGTVAVNDTSYTQRSKINFSSRFAASDSSSPAQTNVDLNASGVTAGTYANPASVTVDAYGRTTAVTPGTGTARTCTSNGCYRVEADGTIEMWGVTSSFGGSSNGTFAVTFPTNFTTTTNLSIVMSPTGCSAAAGACGGGIYPVSLTPEISTLTTSGVTVNYASEATVNSIQAYWHVWGN